MHQSGACHEGRHDRGHGFPRLLHLQAACRSRPSDPAILDFVSWKDRKPAVAALRAIYRAQDAEAGLKALEDFDAGPWAQRYPAIAQSWRRNCSQIVPFFAFPESVRQINYTTKAIEALNAKVRRKPEGIFQPMTQR